VQILKFESLDSTSNYAKTLINEGKAQAGQIIYAVEQTAGRGQASNVWTSEGGKNLTFSLIIDPKNIEPKNQFLISQAVSVGIVKYLEGYGVRGTGYEANHEAHLAPRTSNLEPRTNNICIKWPNDIYVGLKKISGFLTENTIQGDKILFSVIGIGLNVNQTEFPKNVPNPTSLSLINKTPYDLDTELDELTRIISRELESLQFDAGKGCRADYLERLLFLNEEREYEVRGEKIIGKIIGTNEFGLLQIQTKNGTILECDLKEVVYFL
jgi:BirA family biotin operon repressor/biotin-[acetyl-CoA-carboxylase] ligase